MLGTDREGVGEREFPVKEDIEEFTPSVGNRGFPRSDSD
jgi:hypothetical protein